MSDNTLERPLQVRCTFDRKDKKISFQTARNCTYDVLRDKIEQCFSLSTLSFFISWKDDNGDNIDIAADDHLVDAIQIAAAEENTSSAASILSGRSFGSRKITLRVQISVDFEGRLSDSGSIASLDDYRPRSEQASFSLSPAEPEDDAVTVNSWDTRGRLSAPASAPSRSRSRGNLSRHGRPSQLSGESSWDDLSRSTRQTPFHRPPSENQDPFADHNQEPAPDAVFERLKAEEDDSASTNYNPITSNPAWLKVQNERAFRSLGVLPDSSASDSSSLILEQEDQVGDLSLTRAPSGKYYFKYDPGSSDVSNSQDIGEDYVEFDPSIEGGINGKPRPTSRQLNWLAAQQEVVPSHDPHPYTHLSDPSLDTIIPPEILQDIPPAPPGEEDVSSCSNCGMLLDYMKYVCYTCGEKPPGSFLQSPTTPLKGKDRDSSEAQLTYPPKPNSHNSVYTSPSSPTFSSSSKTFVGFPQRNPLSSELGLDASSSTLGLSTLRQKENGYELCPNCIETAGVTHAIEAVLEPGSSPTMGDLSSSSPEDAVIQWRRAAPTQKGQLRHAFLEKMWGHGGWEDVVQSEAETVNCSACGVTKSLHKLFKCASCPSHYLCRACYSLVHDLHPIHAFLVLPRMLSRSLSDSDYLTNSTLLNPSEEQSMVHPGVKCAHCLMEIVGARFHCAECETVDICSNCESAGLPGNIDSADGGHISSHILIKLPVPMANSKVEMVSRKAKNLWSRDPANINRSKAKSEISYARTVIGIGNMRASDPPPNEDHGIACSACRKPIIGVRYQCANCPAPESGYNLCASCEEVSYTVHDPYHAFFKLPRPVQRPIRSNAPFIPVLYRDRAGPSPPARFNAQDPTGYLSKISHPSAVCDRCFDRIQGAWFHCAHCPKDLCSSCESVDTHDDTHVFLVFKATIDMQALKHLMIGMGNPELPLPILNYPVYAN
ncbi:hypothetical protein GYMLUDRAFT_199189 [Collybiopsis luxurians FD-317 M1]|uniref:Uncharacterized protein n=1 Tax=Collybiopsis luxurians FD-317 M1 TaxID=944289 RepID=A0A0D0CR68_9AGAR|nr:hypothetical protein GYMLUDRAFT_199189 [Collybiopsis luxurians FD-317 M1]